MTMLLQPLPPSRNHTPSATAFSTPGCASAAAIAKIWAAPKATTANNDFTVSPWIQARSASERFLELRVCRKEGAADRTDDTGRIPGSALQNIRVICVHPRL